LNFQRSRNAWTGAPSVPSIGEWPAAVVPTSCSPSSRLTLLSFGWIYWLAQRILHDPHTYSSDEWAVVTSNTLAVMVILPVAILLSGLWRRRPTLSSIQGRASSG
jgi:hypothetical protein